MCHTLEGMHLQAGRWRQMKISASAEVSTGQRNTNERTSASVAAAGPTPQTSLAHPTLRQVHPSEPRSSTHATFMPSWAAFMAAT